MPGKRHQVVEPDSFEPSDALGAAWNYVDDMDETHGARRRSRRAVAGTPRFMFEALDGKTIHAADQDWRVEVFSVMSDRAFTWVQLRLVGDTDHMLTLKIARHKGAAEARSVLASWLTEPSRSCRILVGA
jgi:hypothetical protein